MKLFYKSFPVMMLALAINAAPVHALPQNYSANTPSYPPPYSDLRGLVDITQNDLRTAAGLEHGNKSQRERYNSAQGHLSSFDRHLVKGKFDKGEMNKTIGEMKGILDHNVLQASSRDALMHDMEELKIARDRRY